METQSCVNQGSSPVPTKIFYPQNTVRCSGPPLFRSQLARDIACLLDVDQDVISWSCLSPLFRHEDESFQADLLVERAGDSCIIQAFDGGEPVPLWLKDVAGKAGYNVQLLTRADLPSIRLRNAKDLIRYARYDVPLDDRIRLLAYLDEHSSLTVAECLSVFRTIAPIPGLASLILQRIISVDLDESLIGPETIVRRYRG